MSRVDPIAREREREDERKKSDKRSAAQERARQRTSSQSASPGATAARATSSAQATSFGASSRWTAPRPLMTAPTAVKVRGRSKFFDALAVRAAFVPQVLSRRPSVMRPIVLYPYPMNETMLKQYQAQLGPQFQAVPGRSEPTTLGDVLEKAVTGTGKFAYYNSILYDHDPLGSGVDIDRKDDKKIFRGRVGKAVSKATVDGLKGAYYSSIFYDYDPLGSAVDIDFEGKNAKKPMTHFGQDKYTGALVRVASFLNDLKLGGDTGSMTYGLYGPQSQLPGFAGKVQRGVGRVSGAVGRSANVVGKASALILYADAQARHARGEISDSEMRIATLSLLLEGGGDMFTDLRVAGMALSSYQFGQKQAEKDRTKVRARGGRVRSGETTLVGERGPEIVKLPGGFDVISARRSERLLEYAGAASGGVGGGDLHVRQQLDSREIARSTVRSLDDEEQWGWR